MTSPQRESLLDKIRALLSKTVANGCTQEEALAALAKARAMMDVHDVDDDELALTREEKAILMREPRGSEDKHKIKYYLATAVAKFCACESFELAVKIQELIEKEFEAGRARPGTVLNALTNLVITLLMRAKNPHGMAREVAAMLVNGVDAGLTPQTDTKQ